MIRLVADENIVGLDRLPGDLFDITTVPGRTLSAVDLYDADALWVRSVTPVTAALLADSPLRFVGTATAGLEHIDTQALAERGIGFAAAPGANANSVVEYVLAALLELETPFERLEAGAPLGIVGYGHVGQTLHRLARAMGWMTRIHDPWLEAEQSRGGTVLSRGEGAVSFVSLEDVLGCAVISIHCSLTRQAPWPSYHLFDADVLSRLTGDQCVINAARGAVIDNQALASHLGGEAPARFVMDVWENEPGFDAALLEFSALRIGTPHIAGYSWDAKWQATLMLYRAMADQGLFGSSFPSNGRAADSPREKGSDVAIPLCLDSSLIDQGVAALRACMKQRYRIMDDDARFRALLSLAPDERGAGFDHLRRDYPRRRELRGSVLDSGAGPNACTSRLLEAAGVRIAGA